MPLIFTGAPNIVADMKSTFQGSSPQDIAALGIDIDPYAEIMALAEFQLSAWIRESSISTAHGMWLEQRGKDDGIRKQSGETDPQFRIRLRLPPTAGTLRAITEALNQLLPGFTVYTEELPAKSVMCSRSFGLSRGRRMGAGRGMVIAMVPAAANALAVVSDMVRAKASAGKVTLVQEYT